MRGRVRLMGMGIDRITEAEALGQIVGGLNCGRGGWVITPNIQHLREFVHAPEVREPFEQADLVVADGMPLVWASRLIGSPLPERVAGSDIIWSLSAEAALHGRSVYLLGAAPPACDAARARMEELYPGLRIAGCHSPAIGFEKDPAEVDRIRSMLRDARPDIVFVALPFPTQERLIGKLRDVLPSAWFLGIGASLDFIGGAKERAPAWMIKLGLEWLFRLAREPRRLFRRYVLHGLPFAARLAAHAIARRSPAPAELDPPVPHYPPQPRVVFQRGELERERAEDVRALLSEVA
jgi:N-acetylglucosaminyldiphosphoundecaprenol N-acetyl-beta-D-mannosaminyltransferase